MNRLRPTNLWLAGVALAALPLVLLVWHWDAVGYYAREAFSILSDPQRTQSFVEGFGAAAPIVFMAVQMGQVIIAPVPGEVTGFVGGYLFGTLPGFLYSSVALTAGSLINFWIGRRLGRRFVAKHMPPEHLARFDRLFNEKGILVIFFLFLLPGFPKDYFCLFLGLTALPLRLLLLMAAIGRMPGTLVLSIQGAALLNRDYRAAVAAALVSLVVAGVVYRYREPITRWADRVGRHR